MSSENQTPVGQAVKHELQHLRSHWCWLFFLGLLLLLCGAAAVAFPLITSVAAVSVLSVILMIGGVATIVSSFWAGKWSGFLVHLLVGILYLAAGLVVSERPLVTILMLTLLASVLFMVMGSFRVLAALLIRFPQWGWAALNGSITLLAGLVIYRNLPFERSLGCRAPGGLGNAL